MCSDCNVPLVAELAPEREKPRSPVGEKEFVEIGWYSNPGRIAFINSVFEDRGIRFYFLDVHGDGLSSSGGGKLFVARRDRRRAEEILKDMSFDDRPWYVK